jgi:hypothetical protein
MVKQKVEDWQQEGISMGSFFRLALAFLKEEVETCKNATQDILSLIKDFNQKVSAGELNTPISES